MMFFLLHTHVARSLSNKYIYTYARLSPTAMIVDSVAVVLETVNADDA